MGEGSPHRLAASPPPRPAPVALGSGARSRRLDGTSHTLLQWRWRFGLLDDVSGARCVGRPDPAHRHASRPPAQRLAPQAGCQGERSRADGRPYVRATYGMALRCGRPRHRADMGAKTEAGGMAPSTLPGDAPVEGNAIRSHSLAVLLRSLSRPPKRRPPFEIGSPAVQRRRAPRVTAPQYSMLLALRCGLQSGSRIVPEGRTPNVP
jgi:hypothetical protein